MDFPLSAALTPRLIFLESTSSTNDEMRALAESSAATDLPSFSVVVTLSQQHGRGRLGRTWTAPAGTSIAISLLLRETLPLGVETSLLPLVAGLAMVRATRRLGAETQLKWPNDVLVSDRKLSGILCERLEDGLTIVGAGLNLSFTEGQVPVPSATSFAIEGLHVDPDPALSQFLREFRRAQTDLLTEGSSNIPIEIAAVCSTLGKRVKVELPDGKAIVGLAHSIDPAGRLIVEADGRRTAVSAGDVTHLRY